MYVCVYVCVKERKRNVITYKNRKIKKCGFLKSLEAEDKEHELAVVKPGGIERGMSDVVRADKAYIHQVEKKLKKLMVHYLFISSESTNWQNNLCF